MYIKSIEYGSPDAETSIPSPSWSTIEEYLRSLDGATRDGIFLTSSGETYLGISGGRENQFVVAGFIEGRGSVILACGRKGGERQQVVVNGDFNEYDSEHVVTLQDAIMAAREFFERGNLAPQFTWDNQR